MKIIKLTIMKNIFELVLLNKNINTVANNYGVFLFDLIFNNFELFSKRILTDNIYEYYIK